MAVMAILWYCDMVCLGRVLCDGCLWREMMGWSDLYLIAVTGCCGWMEIKWCGGRRRLIADGKGSTSSTHTHTARRTAHAH